MVLTVAKKMLEKLWFGQFFRVRQSPFFWSDQGTPDGVRRRQRNHVDVQSRRLRYAGRRQGDGRILPERDPASRPRCRRGRPLLYRHGANTRGRHVLASRHAAYRRGRHRRRTTPRHCAGARNMPGHHRARATADARRHCEFVKCAAARWRSHRRAQKAQPDPQHCRGVRTRSQAPADRRGDRQCPRGQTSRRRHTSERFRQRLAG